MKKKQLKIDECNISKNDVLAMQLCENYGYDSLLPENGCMSPEDARKYLKEQITKMWNHYEKQ